MKTVLTIIALLLLQACASQPPLQHPRTASGRPEVTILGSTTEIKQNLIARNLKTGWMLEHQSENQLVFFRFDNPLLASSILTQLVIGNSYSTQPKYEAHYVIFQTSDGVKVTIAPSVSTQMPFGQTNRHYLQDSNQVFNAFQTQLLRVKGEVERK